MIENSNITFVLGGARSGKSSFAEKFTASLGLDKIYIATSQIFDDEMQDRVAKHQIDRGADWHTVEEPLALSETLLRESKSDNAILVDCLTLWVTNLMMADQDIDALGDELAAVLLQMSGPVILVSNEVGQGIVPDNAMARAFRDHAGRLHQKIAEVSGEVYFVTAGLPQKLK